VLTTTLIKEKYKNMRNASKTLTSFLILALALTVVGTSALAFPGGAPPAATSAPATSAPAAPTITKGTVVETMDSGGYTYLCIESGGQKKWAAIPQSPIKVGQQVELRPGMEMKQFTSKTLKRTFDTIVFSGGLAAAPASAAAPAAGK
jgi:hypothetical protein